MAIPEAREIIEARFAELYLLFKDELEEREDREKWKKNGSPGSSPVFHPTPNKTIENEKNIIKIVDAYQYQEQKEDDRVRLFLNYFYNHRGIRQVVLDDFYLRILPFSNMHLIENS